MQLQKWYRKIFSRHDGGPCMLNVYLQYAFEIWLIIDFFDKQNTRTLHESKFTWIITTIHSHYMHTSLYEYLQKYKKSAKIQVNIKM